MVIDWAAESVQIENCDHVGQHDLPNVLGYGSTDFLGKTRIEEALDSVRF